MKAILSLVTIIALCSAGFAVIKMIADSKKNSNTRARRR